MYTCQRQLLPNHLLDSCEYREVACPQGKCEATMFFKDASSHTHGRHGCDISGVESVVQDDRDNNHPRPIDHDRASPDSLEVQRSEEPRAETASQECARTSTGPPPPISRSSADSRLATLVEQNVILRQRVEGLETLVHSFKREMSAVRRALGPWYQTGDGVGTAAAGYYSAELPAEVQPFSASTSSVGASPAPNLESSTTPDSPSSYPFSYPPLSVLPAPTPLPSADSLAPYFPSDSEEGNLQPVRRTTTRTHRTSSSISSQQDLYPLGSFHPHQHHAHTPMIAPLNLGTTLEGTLHGLRESMVGLAASVDSMGRRHEIALTNETARMGEEVGGLRAGLHGLRMQMHAIMMDRNAQLTGRDGVGEAGSGQWMPLPAPPVRMYPPPPSITKL